MYTASALLVLMCAAQCMHVWVVEGLECHDCTGKNGDDCFHSDKVTNTKITTCEIPYDVCYKVDVQLGADQGVIRQCGVESAEVCGKEVHDPNDRITKVHCCEENKCNTAAHSHYSLSLLLMSMSIALVASSTTWLTCLCH